MTTANYLSMSDEEWLNQPMPTTATEEVAQPEPEVVPEEVQPPAEEPAADAPADDGATSDEPTGDPEGEATEAVAETPEVPATENTDPPEAAETKAEPDYKAAYEKLTAPFKANGREMQINDVDDAISLMKMGANYNKKMAAMKPNLKLMKMLESNNLLSEEKISYLIDLQNKNPGAINRLIKDSGLDPLELDGSKADEYIPTARKVDDRELELDQVLEEIQESPAYTRTLQVVSKEWDGSSKQVIAESPALLKVINDHVESGIYDIISKQVDHERMLGRLSGLSDIEAYRQIGDSIQARGGFNHIRPDVKTAPPVAPVIVNKARPSEEQVQKVKDRKRIASASSVAAPTAPAKEFNPLALSDDEFNKIVQSKYL